VALESQLPCCAHTPQPPNPVKTLLSNKDVKAIGTVKCMYSSAVCDSDCVHQAYCVAAGKGPNKSVVPHVSTCTPSVIRQSSSLKYILMPSKAADQQILQRLNVVMQQRIREGLQNDAEALRQELKESQAENAKLLQAIALRWTSQMA